MADFGPSDLTVESRRLRGQPAHPLEDAHEVVGPPLLQGVTNAGELLGHSLLSGVGTIALPTTVGLSNATELFGERWPIDEKLLEQISASGETVRDVLGFRGLEGAMEPRLDARDKVVYGEGRSDKFFAGPEERYTGQMAGIDPRGVVGTSQEASEWWKYLVDFFMGQPAPKALASADDLLRNVSNALSPDDLLWRVTSRGKRHPIPEGTKFPVNRWTGQNDYSANAVTDTMRVKNWPYAKQPWQYSKAKLDKITSKWNQIPEDHTRLYRLDNEILLDEPGLPGRFHDAGIPIKYRTQHSRGRWFSEEPSPFYSSKGANLPELNPRPTLRHYDIPSSEADQWLVKNIQDQFVSGGKLGDVTLVHSFGDGKGLVPLPRTGGKGKPPGMDDFEWNLQVMDKYLPMDPEYADDLARIGVDPYAIREPYGGLEFIPGGQAITERPFFDAHLETSGSMIPEAEYLLPRAMAKERVLTHPVMSDTQRRLRYLNPFGW